MMPSQPLVENSSWLEKRKFSFSDIFDNEVQKEILIKIKNMTSEKDNPNLIGYFWTDMPMWNLKKSKENLIDRDGKGYLNAGLRWSASKNLMLEINVNDIFKNIRYCHINGIIFIV